MITFKTYLTEAYNIPIKSQKDIATFQTKLDKKALKQLLGLVKKKRIPYFSYGLVGLKEKIKKAGFKESDFEVALTFKEFKLYYAFNKSIEDKTIKTYQNTLDKVMSNRILLKKIKEKYKKMNMYIPL